MQTAAITNRFLIGDSSKTGLPDAKFVVSHGGLIQQLVASHLVQTVHSRSGFHKLSQALISFAEHAYTVRDVCALEKISRVLLSLPLESAQQVGLYYRALACQRNAQLDEAHTLFERVADNAPSSYRARALQSLGTNHHTRRELDEALRFQLEALRVASDKNPHGLQTTLLAYLQISHIKSDTGDHNGALAILDQISPLVEMVSQHNPLYFYLYHNELAVEFGELNRITRAEAASAIALASPFASAYPEWAETRQELAAKRTSATPSVVPVRQTAESIPASRTEPQHCQKPDRVLAFCRLIIKGTAFQTTLILIAGFNAIADRPIRIDILDQLGRCFRARAPPPQH